MWLDLNVAGFCQNPVLRGYNVAIDEVGLDCIRGRAASSIPGYVYLRNLEKRALPYVKRDVGNVTPHQIEATDRENRPFRLPTQRPNRRRNPNG